MQRDTFRIDYRLTALRDNAFVKNNAVSPDTGGREWMQTDIAALIPL